MEWTHTRYEGYECMADIKARETDEFYYKYGFLALTGKNKLRRHWYAKSAAMHQTRFHLRCSLLVSGSLSHYVPG